MARSTVYTIRARGVGPELREPKKRGSKTEITDDPKSPSSELVAEIREVLRESDFLGEGHRKVRARLRPKGIRVGKNRVLRLIRENGLWRRCAAGTLEETGAAAAGSPRMRRTNCGAPIRHFYPKADSWC